MSQAFTQGYIIKDGQRIMDSSVGALTVQGDVIIGGNSLRTTNLRFRELNADGFYVRNSADNAIRDITLRGLISAEGMNITADAARISANNVDANYYKLQARDSGIGLIEVARVQGAADPYFQATLPMVLSPGAVPGTPVEGMIWYNAATDKLMFRTAVGNETVTSL